MPACCCQCLLCPVLLLPRAPALPILLGMRPAVPQGLALPRLLTTPRYLFLQRCLLLPVPVISEMALPLLC